MDIVTDHPVIVSLSKSRLTLDGRDNWQFRQELHDGQLLLNCKWYGDFVVDIATQTISSPPKAPIGLEERVKQRIYGTDTEYMYYGTGDGTTACYLANGVLQWTMTNPATEVLFFKASDDWYSALANWSRKKTTVIPWDPSKGGASVDTYIHTYHRGVDLYYTGGTEEVVPLLVRNKLPPAYTDEATKCDMTLYASPDGTRAVYTIHIENSDSIKAFRLWNLVDPVAWNKYLASTGTLGEK